MPDFGLLEIALSRTLYIFAQTHAISHIKFWEHLGTMGARPKSKTGGSPSLPQIKKPLERGRRDKSSTGSAECDPEAILEQQRQHLTSLRHLVSKIRAAVGSSETKEVEERAPDLSEGASKESLMATLTRIEG